MADFILGVPPAVVQLVQQGLLERAFHDGLFPALQYRAEATAEEWPANTGTEMFQSRPGLLKPNVVPGIPGTDPVPQALTYEQWAARLAQYYGTIDTHMPTAVVANTNLFLRNIQQLGLQAGQTINRVPRNELFKAYLSGNTALTSVTASADVVIQVASLNGFTDVVIPGTTVRPVPVSIATPLSITIMNGVTPIVRNVIGATPLNAADPFGPGTLTLSATVGAIVATRSSVLSSSRPTVLRVGGGTSVDAIGAADTFTLQDAINAVSQLRKNNVQPHEDGYYHAHISPGAVAQLFADPVFQRLNTAMPEGIMYKEAFVGCIAGILFFMNTESPDPSNTVDTGARSLTGTAAFYSPDIAAETTNDGGVDIGRIVITGKGCIYEKWLDEGQFVTEAGTQGKIGEFDIVNNGLAITTERIRLVIRAPQDRLQQTVSASWSISTCFPIPSDITAGGPQRFKRAIIIEHAI